MILTDTNCASALIKRMGGRCRTLCVLIFIALLVSLGGCNDSDTAVDLGSDDAGSDSGNGLEQVATMNVNLDTPVAEEAKLRIPMSGDSHVGIVIMHPYGSYVDFDACSDLAARGFTTLCVDSKYTGHKLDYYGYEQHVPAIRAAIEYLKGQANITKVLLFGHSMGAPMMTFYQNVAENGPGVCTDAQKLIPCVTTNLEDLPKADGLILFDSHLGESLATYTYVDPAIINNTRGNRDPALDMFSVDNGYDSDTGSASYTDEFRQKFTAAQAARNEQLNAQALQLLADERESSNNSDAMGDDIPFDVAGATSARLWQPDLDLLKCTQDPHVLLSHDGTRPVQVVCSVRVPSGRKDAALSSGSTLHLDVHRWLGAHALRSTGNYNQTRDDLAGIDYKATATSSVGNISGVTIPLLIVANSGHYFLRPDEIVFDAAKMADKTYAIEEGSSHGGKECSACEEQLGLATPSDDSFGYYGDTFGRTMNFMAEWINDRY